MSRKLYGSIEVTDYTVDTVAYPATAVDIIKFREQFSASYTGSAELVRIEVGNAVPTWWMDLVFDDTTRFTVTTNVDWATLVATAATWGISLEATQPTGWAYIPVTFNYGVTNEATIINTLYGEVGRVSKLYGSVNGATKLVHQDFGHVDYSGIWGTVYYRETNYGEEKTIQLQNRAEFESLCTSDTGGTGIVIGDITLYKANLPVITGIDIGTAITDVPDYFGYYMFSLEHITIPEGVRAIGSNFMSDLRDFNSDVQLPSTLISVGKYFFYRQNAMKSEINVGNLPTSILPSSTTDQKRIFTAGSTSYAAYTSGIKIAGVNRAAWRSALPNSSSSPYRKLVDAGH